MPIFASVEHFIGNETLTCHLFNSPDVFISSLYYGQDLGG